MCIDSGKLGTYETQRKNKRTINRRSICNI